MTNWTVIRVLIIIVAFLVSLFGDAYPEPGENMPFGMLLAAFAFSVLGMLFVIGIQRVNPSSAKAWRYPDWSRNPFQLAEPLQFFHFGGYFMIASGAGTLIHSAGAPSGFDLLPLTFGLGILVGVRACTVVYRRKMVSGDTDSSNDGAP